MQNGGHWGISTIAMATCTHRFIHSQRTPEPQELSEHVVPDVISCWGTKCLFQSNPPDLHGLINSPVTLSVYLMLMRSHTHAHLLTPVHKKRTYTNTHNEYLSRHEKCVNTSTLSLSATHKMHKYTQSNQRVRPWEAFGRPWRWLD